MRQLEPQQLAPRAAPEPSQNRASRPQHGPWAPSAESGEKWGKTCKSRDRGLPTLFAAGPGRRRRATERGTRAVQTEPRALNTAPGRRVRRVGKSGVKLVRVKIGVCRHFLQPAAGAHRPSRRGAPPRDTHLVSRLVARPTEERALSIESRVFLLLKRARVSQTFARKFASSCRGVIFGLAAWLWSPAGSTMLGCLAACAPTPRHQSRPLHTRAPALFAHWARGENADRAAGWAMVGRRVGRNGEGLLR